MRRPYAFLSTLSLRRATTTTYNGNFKAGQFLSTLSLRRATIQDARTCLNILISIHALLAESDLLPPTLAGVNLNFYPRSPCGERLGGMSERLIGSVFLSTLSLRRATGRVNLFRFERVISIHALLAESDACILLLKLSISIFLSTLSLRRATLPTSRTRQSWRISIHALLAESDHH